MFLSKIHPVNIEKQYEEDNIPLNMLFIGNFLSAPVLILWGIDSTSHASFYRQLPKTVSYISNTFSFANDSASFMRRQFEDHHGFSRLQPHNTSSTIFELNGYTIVGDGTTAQLTGLLTGLLMDDCPSRKNPINCGILISSYSQQWLSWLCRPLAFRLERIEETWLRNIICRR